MGTIKRLYHTGDTARLEDVRGPGICEIMGTTRRLYHTGDTAVLEDIRGARHSTLNQ